MDHKSNVDRIPTGAQKRIALVAHDHKKQDLFQWIEDNQEKLKPHVLCGTGTTSTLIREKFGFEIESYMSGPVGGDQQIGAQIAEEKIDVLVFFWDPLEAQPHDPDVKALLRLAVLHDAVVAMNPATIDFVFTSPYMTAEYTRKAIDKDGNLKTRVETLGQEVDD